MKGYPRGFLPTLLLAMAAIFLSGLLLAPTTLELRLDWELPWRLPGERRVALAALHAASGFLVLMLTGALWTGHMRSGWRRRKQRGSGLMVVVPMLLLAVTAVAVYYLGDEGWATISALAHLGLGLLLVLPFGWHGWRGHRHAASQRHGTRPPRLHPPRAPQRPKRHPPKTARP